MMKFIDVCTKQIRIKVFYFSHFGLLRTDAGSTFFRANAELKA